MLYSILICTFQCMQVCEALTKLCFFVSQLNHCQINCATYSLVLMYIFNILFRCLLALHRFYFSNFPSFCLIQHCSLICTTLFHLCLHFFSASIIFCVLNSIYSFNHCDSLIYKKQCIF